MISKVFRELSKSSPDGLTPRVFAKMWRALAGGKENLFQENKMFAKFNTSGDGVISLQVGTNLRLG